MKKILTLLTPMAAVLPLLLSAQEQADVGAEVLIREAILIQNVSNIDYGILEYDPADAGGDIVIDPDGAVSVGTTGYSAAGNPTAGSLDIVAVSGESLSISCTATATLALSSDQTELLQLSAVQYKLNGALLTCGVGATSVASQGTDTLNVGATLTVASGGTASSGSYSTSNTGGSPMTFTVTYQ